MGCEPVGTVVVGGGAAGVAAARRLHDAGENVLLVEARDRLGGRAHSVALNAPDGASYTVDRGCGWLHSARRNPWTKIAEARGLTVDRSSPNWDVQWRDLGFTPDEQRASGEASERWDRATRAALGGPDQPLSAFIADDDPWRPMIDAISGYVSGAPLSEVSLHDWAAYEADASNDNWAVREGYGTLIAGHAAGAPVRLSTAVTRVEHGGAVLRLETGDGMIEANRAIICVPTPVLADEGLRFDPPLPRKRDAAAALPLGVADKVFLYVDSPEWPADSHLIGNPHSARTASHRLSPFGWPIIESFFGGSCAESMEDERAATAFVIGELTALLGSDWRRRLTPLAATRWRHEPLIAGSYSHALVGHAGDRQVLAEAVDDRIFFAGEACSPHDFTTAHGAYQTGLAAADAVLSLSR